MTFPHSVPFSVPRISVVTLGVRDLARARAFYLNGLGFTAHPASPPEISFIDCAGLVLALYVRNDLVRDANVAEAPAAFPGFTLDRFVTNRTEVDAALAQVIAAGGRINRPATETFWGGYSGYFEDPDGFVWEVACKDTWRFDEAGRFALGS